MLARNRKFADSLRWRELDSNSQYAGTVNLVAAPLLCRGGLLGTPRRRLQVRRAKVPMASTTPRGALTTPPSACHAADRHQAELKL